jgi:hypothetical protein
LFPDAVESKIISMSERFSERTLEFLRRAGWFPGRLVDVANYEKSLLEDGHAMSNNARAFVQEFGGLMFQSRKQTAGAPSVRKRAWWPGVLARLRWHWDIHELKTSARRVEFGFSGVHAENSQPWEQELSTKLCPVGYDYRTEEALLLADNGKFYAGLAGDDHARKVADTPDLAIELYAG